VPDLKVVRNAKQLASGDKINVRLFKGELMCRVEEVKI
jgi:exonuclease VII large subunit